MPSPDNEFISICTGILGSKKTRDYLEKLFNLPESYTNEDINKAFRRLALRFHPDKHLEHIELATNVMKELSKGKNCLLIGKFPEEDSDNLENDRENVPMDELSIDELLDIIEDNPDNVRLYIKKLKQCIRENRNYLHVTSNQGNTPLYLAAKLGNVELFSWLYDKGADLYAAPIDGGLCPFDKAIAIALRTEDFSILNCIKDKLSIRRLKNAYANTLRNLKGESDILQYCEQELKKGKFIIEVTLEDNPFLICTSVGDSLTPQEKFEFIKKHLKNYPYLYTLLTKEQKADTASILALYSARQEYYGVTALIFFSFIPENISAYFVSALLAKFPVLESSLEPYKHAFPVFSSYALYSLLRSYQAAVFGCILLFGAALALAIAFPSFSEDAPLGPAGGIAVAAILTGIALCLGLHCVYGECRKLYEKTKIDSILVKNNFFKPERAFPFSLYDSENDIVNEEVKGLNPGQK